MIDNDEVVDVLKNLIETTKDGIEGFNECAEKAKKPELKSAFTRAASRCQEGLGELKYAVREFGGDPDEDGSLLASLHRGWLELRTAVSSNDDKVILQECQRGEENAIKNYREALDKDLPLEIRTMVERQLVGVKLNHDQICALNENVA